VIAKTSDKIPGDQPEEGTKPTDGYGWKGFEKRKVLRRERKCHEKRQQAVNDQRLTMEWRRAWR